MFLQVASVSEGLALHAEAVSSGEPLRILAALGGLELAAMTGALLEASSRGLVALVDGFISSVAALCAVKLEPNCRDALLLTTTSAERGAAIVASALGGARCHAVEDGRRIGNRMVLSVCLVGLAP